MTDETVPKVATWFEVPAADFERAVRFYERLLGADLRREEFCGTTMAVFPHADRAVSGAILHPSAGIAPSRDGINVYLWVEPGIDEALARARAAGAEVATPKTALPEGMGCIADIIDTEGNRIGLHASR